MTPLKPDSKFNLPRAEVLRGKKEISELFTKGSVFYFKPFKVFYIAVKTLKPNSEPPKLLFSVPKSKFQKASTRNLVKRRIREAYRLNKGHLKAEWASGGIKIKKMALVYVEDQVFSFALIQQSILAIPRKTKKFH